MRDTRSTRVIRPKLALTAALALGLGICTLAPSSAKAQNVGFQLNRYEPTAAGQWSFSVDHPWYNKTRDFAAGLTLNYAHNPLVFGLRADSGEFTKTQTVIAHHLLFHVDMALAFWNRVNVNLTLPVVALERGEAVGAVVPREMGALGDPRLGLMVRLYGEPDHSKFSLHLGGYLWFPVSAFDERAGDTGVRVLPKLVASGLYKRLRYSANLGFYYRPEATVAANLADVRGGEIGPSMQFGALVQYADLERRFAIGPELISYTTVTGGHAFRKDYTNLEILLGGHYNIAGQVQTGLAVGVGALRDPGTPDFRLLFRIAYAPIKKKEELPKTCPTCEVCKKCEEPPPPPPPICGNGVLEKGEQCDDGNTINGDRCSASCVIEPPPKVCKRLKLKAPSVIRFEPDEWSVETPRYRKDNVGILNDIADQIRNLQDNQITIEIQGHTSEEGPSKKGIKSKRHYQEYLNWAISQKEGDPSWPADWIKSWSRDGAAPKEDDNVSIWYNQWLSEQRSKAVQKWLVDHGVNKELRPVGYGLRRPDPAPEATESFEVKGARRLKNRRVEFVVVSDNCQADLVPTQRTPAN